MNYEILVNKENPLDKDYVPSNLVDSKSKYNKGIMVNNKLLEQFNLMREDALKLGYRIDIMSGYRSYAYQEKIYNKLLKEKGLAYTFRSIAKPGCSEHQTGLAIDICVYRNDMCFIEHEIADMEEISWLMKNSYKYGFILRYPAGGEDITGYNYEPWHYRYVGDIAKKLYNEKILLDSYNN